MNVLFLITARNGQTRRKCSERAKRNTGKLDWDLAMVGVEMEWKEAGTPTVIFFPWYNFGDIWHMLKKKDADRYHKMCGFLF